TRFSLRSGTHYGSLAGKEYWRLGAALLSILVFFFDYLDFSTLNHSPVRLLDCLKAPRIVVTPVEHRIFPSTKRPRVQEGLRGCSVLLNGAGYRGESIIGIRANETNRANYQDQDHGEHHRVFCDVLPAVVSQNLGENTHFSAIPFNRENSDFRLAGYVRQPNSEPDSTGAIVLRRPRRVNRKGSDFASGSGIQQISKWAVLVFGVVCVID